MGGAVGSTPAGAKATKDDGRAVSPEMRADEPADDDSDAGGMTEARIDELRAAFEKFDLDGSGN
eukprot:976016-Prymnesium_polylepis.1